MACLLYLGAEHVKEWRGGSYESLLESLSAGHYFMYVDRDHNGDQTDMPYDFCYLVIDVRKMNTSIFAFTWAFDIVDGAVSVKCNGGSADRDFNWHEVFQGYV